MGVSADVQRTDSPSIMALLTASPVGLSSYM